MCPELNTTATTETGETSATAAPATSPDFTFESDNKPEGGLNCILSFEQTDNDDWVKSSRTWSLSLNCLSFEHYSAEIEPESTVPIHYTHGTITPADAQYYVFHDVYHKTADSVDRIASLVVAMPSDLIPKLVISC